ncbi:MAG TPA: sigma-70 family RNA polymerase sigma factor [Pirellulaceae bacterium]|nr:sigma-70 family RNA polymerase sigma factor [Pirellulaceae bacterium]HMO91311.1 sigma-70 family RNA polymerase sigma factor [Pirellulaceae bacterium]HMP68505.1 sigma-70 family RNA polymerase sigma factor [Pirellulaceae bacterium]
MTKRPANEIVQQHADHLVNVVRRNMPNRLKRRLDPEDIVQSVFRSYFRRRDHSGLEADSVQDVGRFLVAMTLNKVRNAIAYHQRQRRDVRQEITFSGETREPEISIDDWNSEHVAILADLLERILQGLPDIHREMVLLRMSGESIATIADRVERSQRTVIRVLSGLDKLVKEESL